MFYAIHVKKFYKIIGIWISIFFILYIILGMIIFPHVLYPQKYMDQVLKYSEIYDLHPYLVYAVIRTESHFDPNAISHKGAKGLMQISDQTGEWAAKELSIVNYESNQLFDPDVNIQIGCWYLAKLLQQFNNKIEIALAAYNAGSGNVSKWLKNQQYSTDNQTLNTIPFPETKKYIQKVLANYYYYERFHGRIISSSNNIWR